MCIVDIGCMLRRFEMRLSSCITASSIIANYGISIVSTIHNLLLDIHIRHLQNKTKRIDGIYIPIIPHFEHIVLEVHSISRIGVVFESRCFAVGLIVNVILRIDLRELSKSISFFSAVVEVKRYHIHLQIPFDIIEIHSSVAGGKHTIQTFGHVAFGLNVDNSSLSACIIFSRWIRDNFYFFDGISVGSIEHCFELLSAKVGWLSVNPNLHRFSIDGNVSILIYAHAGSAPQDVVSVRTGR